MERLGPKADPVHPGLAPRLGEGDPAHRVQMMLMARNIPQRAIAQEGLTAGRFYCIYNPEAAVVIEDEALVHKEAENIFRADARATLEELQEVIGADFDPGQIAGDADTLGGLIVYLIDRVPVRGEVITRMKGFEFEVLAADPRRIRRVRITRRPRGLKVRVKPRPETGPETGTRSAAE